MKITRQRSGRGVHAIVEIEGKERARLIASHVLAALIQATPVDTGYARNGWQMDETATGFRISNAVEYILVLNNGHSKQAAAGWIEDTAEAVLRYYSQ